MKQNQSLSNPGYLKLELLVKGVRLDRSALVAPTIVKALALSESLGAPLEVSLILDRSVMVNIPVLECLNRQTPYSLGMENGRYLIRSATESVEVEVAPPPAFYEKRTSSGLSMGDVGRVYGEYLVVSPKNECVFISKELPCRYCDLNAKMAPDRSVSDLVETAAAAAAEGIVSSVCFNVGFTLGPDGGIKLIEEYVRAIKSELGLLIAVQAQPPASDEWVDYTYAAGIDSLAYNLEVYDPELFDMVAPGKASMIGRSRYLEALRRAAKVFPEGAVVSNLIIGLEPLASTMKGIDYLTSMGVVPTLPIVGPVVRRQLGTEAAFDTADIAKVFLHLQAALNRNRLAPSLISHFNMAINAIEGQFFGGEAPLTKRLPAVLRSSAGSKIALGIRRKLRVRPTHKEDGEL